ncbi:hypothetical protein [Cystobacter ferrugineus]|uniref:Uncharacterized protein n=1 Tax=Cystobacter ferrugineus TaxID=83449 RepID=A0A1L9B191_9BACT|nr:hypothetical protein [Cystobacter ferrugineus]OJH35923.1 hypothetical protein BON30_35505 [Cystobacter ferrugineus]
MAEIFSAYARPQWNVSRLLGRAGLVLLAGLVCLVLLQMFIPPEAPLVLLAGAIVWAVALVGLYLFPNRLTYGFVLFGVLLVGTGILLFAFGPTCYCEDTRSARSKLRRTLLGEPEPQEFTIICI